MGECARLGRGRTDWYGPVRTCTDRDNPRVHNSTIWGVLGLCKVRAKLCKVRAWSERLLEALCILRADKHDLVVWNQKSIKRRCLVDSMEASDQWELSWWWLATLVQDRLAVAVKERPALTMYLDRYKERFRGALEAPIRAKPPHPIRRQLSLHQSRCITQIGTDPTPHLSHPSFKSH